jgi:hypothetical protein
MDEKKEFAEGLRGEDLERLKVALAWYDEVMGASTQEAESDVRLRPGTP